MHGRFSNIGKGALLGCLPQSQRAVEVFIIITTVLYNDPLS